MGGEHAQMLALGQQDPEAIHRNLANSMEREGKLRWGPVVQHSFSGVAAPLKGSQLLMPEKRGVLNSKKKKKY